MKATEAAFLPFIRKSPQFVIPIYQRNYSWEEPECRQLWDDILRAGSNDDVTVHFVGSIVYIEDGLSQISSQSPLMVIDGQQRLTSVTILLAALYDAVGETEPLNGFSAKKIKNYYLLNPEETGDRNFKLLLSDTDRETLKAVVLGEDIPKNHSFRVKDNYELFKDLISNNTNKLEEICKGLMKLVVVDIALNRDQDNPQLIFESMNSTGRELTQADLIRNYILMGLEPKLQAKLYTKFWRPMELDFGQEAYRIHFDAFMRYYLTAKTGDLPRLDRVYEAFKKFSQQPKIAKKGVEFLVEDIRDYSNYFCCLALDAEPDQSLRLAFKDLRDLKVDVAYPLLLELYHDYAEGLLPQNDFTQAVRLIEAYVFRRVICSIPTNSMNKTFATFHKALKKDRYLESIQAHLINLRSYRRFPNDEEFIQEFQSRDLYNFRSRSYWLRRFENHGRKEQVSVGEYTIEHIMPQNEALSPAWKNELGADWDRVHQTWLHTLGNLTLTGYNSEYSDRVFAEKRDMKGGFKESPLRLNKGLGHVDKWNEEAIKKRAQILATTAPEVWKSPKLSQDVLAEYRKETAKGKAYTLQEHPHLTNGKMKAVFEAFRKEILALDPCVTEEVLKLYVAYKAETNFVDVVPQASQLRLSLNMKFADISDIKGICKDVTGLGRWGNGDVEVRLSDIDDIPYIVGLVRQSLEQQLGLE